MNQNTTIAAIATPSGQGGIAVVRLSGPDVPHIASKLLKHSPTPRYAHYAVFHQSDGKILDQGIALYFPKPHSFTGEDVLELHLHGSPIILDLLLKHLLMLGAVLAKPGEFSERAFLNGKIDLVQAEAIADLISATSEQAAQSAVRSLQGEFSKQIHALVTSLINLRMFIEAGLDFPDEEIDLHTHQEALKALEKISTQLQTLENTAIQGTLLRDGMQVVLVGEPNVGKSSLLNQLSGQDTAIVTNIPGTTRDVLREHIHIDGLPLHIIDTAGVRITDDIIEREGIRRTQQAFAQADHILWILDQAIETLPDVSLFFEKLPAPHKLTLIRNKIDLLSLPPQLEQHATGYWMVHLSAKTGAGVDLLRSHLKSSFGFFPTTENMFIARRRHLQGLQKANIHLQEARKRLTENKAVELFAEELRLTQSALSEITGEFLPDDLLGEIFSRFCIGK
jgi:tRNA modification GTPase